MKFYLITFCLIYTLCGCKDTNLQNLAYVFTPPPIEEVSRIAFGSCNKINLDQSYWQSIAAKRPDLWIWLGDIVYADTEDMEQMAKSYGRQKRNVNYLSFIKQIPVMGIWDDHDYGVNDGDKKYPRKVESKDLLLSFLDVDPKNPVWDHSGAYQSYQLRCGAHTIKLILLDCRYFRDPLQPGNSSAQSYQPNQSGTILGEEQWEWFSHEIQDPSADFLLIGSGIQIIPDQHSFEKWANFPQERTRFFDLLKSNAKVPIILLSGDRHIAEVSKFQVDSMVYPIYEITSSGLTHSYENAGSEVNQYRVSPLVPDKNFGLLEFTWMTDTIRVSASVYGIESGESLIDWKWDYYPE